MSQRTDPIKISMGIWEVVRRDGDRCPPHLQGKPYGLRLTGGDYELQGEDFLSREEALELRDYIDKHLGAPRD